MLDFNQVAARVIQFTQKTSEQVYYPELALNRLNEELLRHFDAPDYPTQVETVCKIILNCIGELWKMTPDPETFSTLQDESFKEVGHIANVTTYEPAFYISTVLSDMRFGMNCNHLKNMHSIIHFCLMQLRGYNLTPIHVTDMLIIVCNYLGTNTPATLKLEEYLKRLENDND